MSVQPGTPLPWAWEIDDKDIFIGEVNGTNYRDAFARVDYDDVDHEAAQADAAYIVTACNSFPELVAALENAKWLLEGIKRAGWVTQPSFGDEINFGLERMSAALSKVQLG